MEIDPQVAAIRAAQGSQPVERRMLDEAFVGPPAPTSTQGVNVTLQLELAGGEVVFHKPFAGVHVANAIAYGQTDETPPLHEVASWRLAVALGQPWREIVAPCVLRAYDGEDGALVLQAPGRPRQRAPLQNPTWCVPAAFFDSLVAQQDRHDGNWRWDGAHLTLIDHGYTFALPGAILNYSNFVVARHERGAAALLEEERKTLTRLLADRQLLGMAGFLQRDRADALAARADRMLKRDAILRPGEF
jgi:hypothetical protein